MDLATSAVSSENAVSTPTRTSKPRSRYRLDAMTMSDLVKAYFGHYAIQMYIVLAALLGAFVLVNMDTLVRPAIAAVAAMLIYPLVWYLLHRFVLHGSYLYKSARTAALWKRIHYDHHQDPCDLRVLFGAPYTTLPTIVLATFPLGLAIGGWASGAAAVAAALLTTCFYEFCHCVQHLRFVPKSRYLRRLKRLHIAHHYHNEDGNFGITNFAWDKIFKTYYEKPKQVKRSPTVFNLGYTATVARRYPWVARLTPGFSPACDVAPVPR